MRRVHAGRGPSVPQVTRGRARIRTAAVRRYLDSGRMAPFVVVRDTPLPVEAAWERIVDWAAHARYVPLTRIAVRTPPPNGLATVFSARTGVGRIGFDDPMEVVELDPPHDGSAGR